MRTVLFSILLIVSGTAQAADLSTVDRTIGKEPKYAGAPRYCLLVFGAVAKHRVWLVHDGDTLYIDRNGNGDLTEAGEKVPAKKDQPGASEGAFSFEVGELKVGGKVHKGLEVVLAPVKSLGDNPNLIALPQVAAAVKKDPNGVTGRIGIDVDCESLKGGGIGGRVSYMLSLFDLEGVFQLANKPADAPIVHFDGPLEITFYGSRPTWRGGRSEDTVLCIGTPGHGPGTFAMVKYEGTIPPDKLPRIDAAFTPKDANLKPLKELYELKERC
jgi:hypothetical protein